MIGWGIAVTLVILILCYLSDMQASIGRAFGWPAPMTNWAVVNTLLIVGWILLLLFRFHVIKF